MVERDTLWLTALPTRLRQLGHAETTNALVKAALWQYLEMRFAFMRLRLVGRKEYRLGVTEKKGTFHPTCDYVSEMQEAVSTVNCIG